MHAGSDVFLGRQPILDRRGRIVAYELLYRSSAEAGMATFSDQNSASAQVMMNTFTSLGADQVLGDCLGFFNITGDLLIGDLLQVLPPERMVVEILEDVVSSPDLIARCKSLRKAGFRLALDDYIVDDPRAPMLDLVDFVKVDLPSVPVKQLRRLVRRLRSSSARLVAEKLETQEEFRRCLDLGFELFQGYFFARPDVLQGRALSASQTALISLIAKLNSDVEVDEIVDVFKHEPTLGINLMRLMNSSAMARQHPLGSLVQAVNHLGRRNLQRWITMLLYTENDGFSNPLLPTAARRGRLMELVWAALVAPAASQGGDSAFLVGMLSLVDVLLEQPLDVVLGSLNLHEDVSNALLKQEGALGTLLVLVKAVESLDMEQISSSASELGVEVAELQALDHSAYGWVHDLTREGA